jgi:hypothetical protein
MYMVRKRCKSGTVLDFEAKAANAPPNKKAALLDGFFLVELAGSNRRLSVDQSGICVEIA